MEIIEHENDKIKKIEKITVTKMNNEELEPYLKKKGSNHNNYRFYAPEYKINSIIDDGYLYLSDGKNWNDPVDSGNMPKNSFALCLSYLTEESVAMWMLYGGINKKGATIKFSKKSINNICKTSAENISFGHFESNKFIKAEILWDQFEEKKFDAYLIDIGYFLDDLNQDTIIRQEEKIHLKEEIHGNLHYIKSHPWNYENECRLIFVTHPKDPELFKLNKINTLRIKLSEEDLNDLKKNITLSPIYPENGKNTKRNYVPQHSPIKVKWDLCPHECKYKL